MTCVFKMTNQNEVVRVLRSWPAAQLEDFSAKVTARYHKASSFKSAASQKLAADMTFYMIAADEARDD